jgi:hypothetical protein
MKISYYYCFNCKKKFHLSYAQEKELFEKYAYKLGVFKPFLFFVAVCPYCKKWQNVCGIKRKFIVISVILAMITPHIDLFILTLFPEKKYFKIGNFLFSTFEIEGLLLMVIAVIFGIFIPTYLFYKD